MKAKQIRNSENWYKGEIIVGVENSLLKLRVLIFAPAVATLAFLPSKSWHYFCHNTALHVFSHTHKQ